MFEHQVNVGHVPRLVSRLLLIALIAITIPLFANAHGTGSHSLEAHTEKGFIDVGYEPSEFQAGKRISLDFDLRTKALPEGEAVHFDRVFVRLVSGEVTLFSSGIARAPFGPTALTLVLPHEAAGTMTMVLRFERGGVPIAETEFRVPVREAPIEYRYREQLAAVAAGLLLGIGFMFAYAATRSKKAVTASI